MDTKLRDHKVQEGMLVQVELIQRSGETEWLEFTLVKDELSDFRAGFLGLGTPLAKKILGKYEDAIVDYTEGDLSSVRILSVEPSDKTPTEDVNSRRNELMRKVRNQAEHIILAISERRIQLLMNISIKYFFYMLGIILFFRVQINLLAGSEKLRHQ